MQQPVKYGLSVLAEPRIRRRVDPQVGDEVLIVGQQGDAMVTIEEMCETLNTIPHELCIGFAQRMPRYYV